MVELFLQAIDVNLDSSIVIGSEEPRWNYYTIEIQLKNLNEYIFRYLCTVAQIHNDINHF